MKTIEDITMLGAASQGYCTKRNEHKIMDPDLLIDVVSAIKAHLVGEIDKVRLEASTMDMNTRCEDMCDSIPYIEALSDIIELIEKS